MLEVLKSVLGSIQEVWTLIGSGKYSALFSLAVTTTVAYFSVIPNLDDRATMSLVAHSTVFLLLWAGFHRSWTAVITNQWTSFRRIQENYCNRLIDEQNDPSGVVWSGMPTYRGLVRKLRKCGVNITDQTFEIEFDGDGRFNRTDPLSRAVGLQRSQREIKEQLLPRLIRDKSTFPSLKRARKLRRIRVEIKVPPEWAHEVVPSMTKCEVVFDDETTRLVG